MKDNARQQIIAATLKLIGSNGIGGVSNRAVAQAAEVSPGTLTYHFPDQENLLSEALNSFVDDEVARLTAMKKRLDAGGADPRTTLEETRVEVEDRVDPTEHLAQFELYLHAARVDDLKGAADRCYRAYDHSAESLLTTMGVTDPARYAPLITSFVDGLELRRLALGEATVDLGEALTVLLAGIGGLDAADRK
ncbi:MAG: TetR family transcriptional regulator [Gordonia sp. (in: high G+C Gram-positive bacteria)]|uniref:TetR/AcrR family transcriptional regulator n=1 Tax=Gordonia sp. (in: high G+C Gram-positive bacteria) TaxID=84139 RepID=UPI0039E2A223